MANGYPQLQTNDYSYTGEYFPDPATGYYENGGGSVLPVAAGGEVIPFPGGGLQSQLREIVARAAAAIGRPLTSSRLVTLIRSLGRYFPVGVIAGFLGISLMEILMLLAAKKKRRRMNPANVKALRRSLRRLDSFACLSQRVMGHRATFRRARRTSGRCRVCKVTPCRC